MNRLKILAPLCLLPLLAGAQGSRSQPGVEGDRSPNFAFFRDLKSRDVASDPSLVWRQFGPGMSGNNKSALWHPTDPRVLFIAPNMGNSYRSIDAGHTYETILDEDAPGIRSGKRGPQDITSMDFSRQSPDHGFCTDEKNLGIFLTTDRGRTWSKQQSSVPVFGEAYLACVAVNPKNENIWYVGAGRMRDAGHILFTQAKPHGTFVDANSQGKIWKSADQGKTWTLKPAGLNPKTEVETIAVDPSNPAIVYASTNYGFYRSEDAGESWQLKIGGLDNDVLRSFALHHDARTSRVTLYVINSIMWQAEGATVADLLGGIFRSVDRGETWQKVNGNLALDLRPFARNKAITKSYYHAVAYYFGLTDQAAMAKFPQMPSSITQRFNQLTVDPKNAANVYLVNMYANASRNNFMPGQLWRTKDGGTHWFVAFRNGRNWNTGPDVPYWQNRGNPLGTNVSIRYLHHWVNREDYDRKSCNFTAFNADGSVLHTQMAKIALMSYDHGDTWVDIDDVETTPGSESYVGAGSSNLPGHGFFQDLRRPGQVFCAGGENGLWVTNDEGDRVRKGAQAATSREILPTELSLSCYAIHPQDPAIHYALFFRQDARGELLRTTDNGKTWQVHGTPIPKWEIAAHQGDQPVHQVSLIFDPENPDTMYFCVPRSARTIEYVGDSVTAWGIHQSTDGGRTWTEPNTGLPKSLNVSRLAFAPGSSHTLYAAVMGKDGGLYGSSDRGGHWSQVASTTVLSGNSGVNDIHFAVDGKAYITAGFRADPADAGGLWVSDDGLKTWKRIFDYPWVNRVEVAKYDPRVILISTLANTSIELRNPGTYLSKDGGATWIKFNRGNGQSDRINDIAIDYQVRGKYYASTYGSGWYVAREKDSAADRSP